MEFLQNGDLLGFIRKRQVNGMTKNPVSVKRIPQHFKNIDYVLRMNFSF